MNYIELLNARKHPRHSFTTGHLPYCTEFTHARNTGTRCQPFHTSSASTYTLRSPVIIPLLVVDALCASSLVPLSPHTDLGKYSRHRHGRLRRASGLSHR